MVWADCFENLGRALARLCEIMEHESIEKLDYLQDAAFFRFKRTIDLFWKVLKKFLAYEKVDSTTPRDVLQKAYQYKLIDDDQVWLAMLDDRNKMSHVYDEDESHHVFVHIKKYLPVMTATYAKLQKRFISMS